MHWRGQDLWEQRDGGCPWEDFLGPLLEGLYLVTSPHGLRETPVSKGASRPSLL